ncbi:MAG: hypothetical protein PHD99_04910 [Candidatus Moranbacteria bacterium]|nr:hypothetical protein [Candidatus Moranbacteria bacterium]
MSIEQLKKFCEFEKKASAHPQPSKPESELEFIAVPRDGTSPIMGAAMEPECDPGDHEYGQCATADQYWFAANMRNEVTAGEYAAHMRRIIDAARATPQSNKPDRVVGTKTWFEDGKMVTLNLTASEVYKPNKPPELLADSEIIGMAYDCNALPECITDKTLFALVRRVEAAILEKLNETSTE